MRKWSFEGFTLHSGAHTASRQKEGTVAQLHIAGESLHPAFTRCYFSYVTSETPILKGWRKNWKKAAKCSQLPSGMERVRKTTRILKQDLTKFLACALFCW
jgi:hypothetical protein